MRSIRYVCWKKAVADFMFSFWVPVLGSQLDAVSAESLAWESKMF